MYDVQMTRQEMKWKERERKMLIKKLNIYVTFEGIFCDIYSVHIVDR